jgi:hypothetical protein
MGQKMMVKFVVGYPTYPTVSTFIFLLTFNRSDIKLTVDYVRTYCIKTGLLRKNKCVSYMSSEARQHR